MDFIAPKLRNVGGDLLETDGTSVAAAKKAGITLIDLNGDGKPEVIVRQSGSFCSATGNCQTFVLTKKDGKYVELLEEVAQTYAIPGQSTGGFKDFVLGFHNSAEESALILFRMAEGRYQEVGGCSARREYLGDPQGKHPRWGPLELSCVEKFRR